MSKKKSLVEVPSLKNLPHSLDGDGYSIVNLASIERAELQIKTAKVARTLYEWDCDVVDYSAIAYVERGSPFRVMISSVLSSDCLDQLAESLPTLHAQLSESIIARRNVIDQMISEGLPIPFELLVEAANRHLGKLVVLNENGVEFCGKLERITLRQSMFGSYITVTYNGKVWNKGALVTTQKSIRIAPSDPKSMEQWGFNFDPTKEKLDALLARGRKVFDLNEKCGYININGTMSYRWMWGYREAEATGRAIVDLAGYGIFNPDFSREDSGEESIPISDASEDDLRCLDPNLTIFSFVSKRWGKVYFNKVSDISFRTDAFEKLVLADDDKKLVLSLVRNSDNSMVSDLIDNKGGGCVLLLHGKPGLGKTLTAEAVAEVLRRPLYAASVGELGTDPTSLEENLQKVLQTAQRWNAVLLLDEADIFLESRKSGDIDRNAMVGTFLRLMEYYNGVLILTTNRVTDIDSAFYSRISLALKYKDFDDASRLQVIENLLHTNGVILEDGAIRKIAKMSVNGRQIKNAIRLGRFMAKDEARSVRSDDIIMVLERLQNFQDSFDPLTPEDFPA